MSNLKATKGAQISATNWNRLVDRLPSDAIGQGVGGVGVSRTLFRVTNSSGANRDVGEIVSLSSYGGSTESVFDVLDSLELTANVPTWHTSISSIGICAEPIPDGEQGLVVVNGLCVIKLTSAATSGHTHVFVDPTTTTEGKSSYSGFAKILDSTTLDDSTELALAMMGHEQNLWRYECTGSSSAPSSTSVNLQDRRGNSFGTVNLLDPLSIMSDQTSGDTGWCLNCGNEFEAIQAPCS